MAFWQLPPESLRADPPLVETTALARPLLRLDVRKYLAAGQRLPQAPAPRTTLRDLDTDRPMPLPSPQMTGAIIAQALGELERLHTYQLVWSWATGGGERVSRITIVRVVA